MSEPKQRPSVTTFRISEIPIILSKPELLETIQHVLELDSSAMLHSSLALSPVDQDRFQVATMTFDHIPPPLVPCIGTREQVRLDIPAGDVTSQISFDTHFLGLTPLNDGTRDYDVDLIFVTGLAGHAFGSWKARGKRTMWVRDFLSPDLDASVAGGVRILTYGYDSTLLASTSNAGVAEFARSLLDATENARLQAHEARRPLVFVGHSLGGIVVKQALVHAAAGSAADRAVHRATYACVLLGVPNRGLAVAQLCAMVRGQRNERLVADLRVGSEFLRALQCAFGKAFGLAGRRVVSVYETRMSRAVERAETGRWQKTGPLVEMVSKESAVLCTPGDAIYDQLSRDVDHSDLAKFSSRADYDYIQLRGRIIECLTTAPDVILARLADTEPAVNRRPAKTTPVVTELDCFNTFKKFIAREKPGLARFYDSDDAIRTLAPAAKAMVDRLFAIGYIKQTALELSMLVLYDVVMLIDDSSSMQFEQEGRRIKTLHRALHEITAVYDLANPAGIKAIQFMNAKNGLTNITNDGWKPAFHERVYRGVSRVGTALHQKILKPFVWRTPMSKPLLIMIITDGAAEGERAGALEDVIATCIARLSNDPTRGTQAVAFQFLHVGDDADGRDRLQALARSARIGEYVGCGGEMERLQDPRQRWRYVVMPRVMLGAVVGHWGEVDEEFDVSDEDE